MTKAMHLADIHASDANIQEVMKCCDFTLHTAMLEKPDLIIIAGDVFDSRDIKLDTQACKYIFQFMNKLSEIAPVAIVAGTPLHEGHATENLIFASAFEHNIVVSTGPEQLCLCGGQLRLIEDINYANGMLGGKGNPDAVISMLPTPTKQFMQGTDSEISQALTPIFAGFASISSEYECPHILVGHFSVRGAALSESQVMVGRDIEITKDQLSLGNFTLCCLGHIHLKQKIEPNIFYSGSLFANNYGETQDHGFYIHEIG